jgi:hypothetical protein
MEAAEFLSNMTVLILNMTAAEIFSMAAAEIPSGLF